MKERTALTATWAVPTVLVGPSGGPIEQSSPSPPILSTFTDGNVYVAYRAATTDEIKINFSSNGTSWPGSSTYTLSATTVHRPGLTIYNSSLYLAYINKTDGTMGILKSTTPSSSSSWTTVTGPTLPATALAGPSIASFNGYLYLAYTDTNNKIQVINYNASSNTWGTFSTVKDSTGADYLSSDGPCLWSVTTGSINYRLYICLRTPSIVFTGYAVLSSGNVTSWTAQSTSLGSPFSIIDNPQVAPFDDDFELAVAGPVKDIRYGASTNEGVTWGSWGSIDNYPNGSPSIVQKGTILVMAFAQGSTSASKSYVMTTYATFV